MQWLADVLAHLGTHGAYANASEALAAEREVDARLDHFLRRFAHPAGRSSTPLVSASADEHRVA